MGFLLSFLKIALALYLHSFFFSAFVLAGLKITPSRQEIQLNKGEVFKNKYFVRNDFSEPVRIAITSKEWFLLPENQEMRLKDWLTLDATSLYLQPNEEQGIPFTVSLPTTAAGSSVAMVSFTPEGTSAAASMRLSVALFVTAVGTEKINFEPAIIKISSANQQQSFTLTLKNKGNIYIRPRGSLSILDLEKQPLCELLIFDDRPLYPGGKKNLTLQHSGCSLPLGEYTGVLTLKNSLAEAIFKREYRLKVQKEEILIIAE